MKKITKKEIIEIRKKGINCSPSGCLLKYLILKEFNIDANCYSFKKYDYCGTHLTTCANRVYAIYKILGKEPDKKFLEHFKAGRNNCHYILDNFEEIFSPLGFIESKKMKIE